MDLEYVDEYSFSRNLLTPGEIVVWKGKPGRKHLVTKQDLVGLPMMLLAAGVFSYNLIKMLREGGDWKSILICIVPVVILLYLSFGRFIHAAMARRRTWYVITNRKIIRKRGKSIDMLDSKNMPPMQMTSYEDGSGTIVFGGPTQYRNRRGGVTVHIDPNQFKLEAVENVVRIHQLISEMEDC